MRPRLLAGTLLIVVIITVCSTFYLTNQVQEQVHRPQRILPRNTPTPTVTPPPSPSSSPSSTPPSSPSSSPIPSSPTPSRSPEQLPSWRDIQWENYPVIEHYKEYNPREESLNPCEQSLPFCDRVAQYRLLHYPNYQVPTPNFADTEDRIVWLKGYQKTYPETIEKTTSCAERGVDICATHPEWTDWEQGIVFDGDIETKGRILSLYNATVIDSSNQWNECGNMHDGWSSSLTRNMSGIVAEEAFAFKVPGFHEFQHFLDGSFPKFVQWLDYMDTSKTSLIMTSSPGGRFLCELPREQELPSYCKLKPEIVSARLLHFGCYTPTLHPFHWRRMQTVVGVRDVPFSERNLIIYATRAGSQNTAQRLVLNDNDVRHLIQTHFQRRNLGEEVVIYNSREYSPLENLKLWNSARAVIGPHGGALYNTFFCLPDTVLVEFLDVQGSGIPWNHLVPHKASSFLNHKYYSMPQGVVGKNFDISLEKLQVILDKEFPIPTLE